MKSLILFATAFASLFCPLRGAAHEILIPEKIEAAQIQITEFEEITPAIDTSFLAEMKPAMSKPTPISPYWLPYSFNRSTPDWKRMWYNTAVLSGAFIGTLVVLETLPEGSTNWSRAEIRETPFYERWWNHVKKGPRYDHDNPIFNYVLHPYAGAVYFMSARSCGFNFWQSLLYSFIISDIGWEFGIEATMERPSVQDLIITPGIGSLIGEAFFHAKHKIVNNGYYVLGSKVIGHIIAFLIDPVNEVMDLFRTSPARQAVNVRKGFEMTFQPTIMKGGGGFAFSCTF
ncbi:MAG: DUF3943 domain-containing protein [Bacteroidales bacterium]|nr:DUF3943 domain-containing protein [Bacteroidales bacterium]